MRAFIHFATLAAVIVLSSASPITNEDVPVVVGYKQGDKCPAPFFKDDCNSCFCLPDGHSAGCTKMACLPRRPIPNGPAVPVVHEYKQGDECPDQVFFHDCNQCSCINGHNATCTKMACTTQPEARVNEEYRQGNE